MKREPSREVGSSTPSPSRRRRATSTATPTGAYTEEDTKVGADDIKPIIKSGTKKRKPKKNGDRPGDWTSAKRAIFIEKVLTAGYKALDLDAVAEEVSYAHPMSN